jgi:non-specific serine/threonine protein kinase
VDGIPLAVELAAVRLRSLSPEQILSRLGARFQLLSGGGPAGQPHHRTLQAALEWSYELLTDGEQALWRRMSVFAGSFDLDAAEAVCAVGRVATGQVADLVDALVAKSILLREGQGTARYRLLDTIRDFGLAKLRGRGNERALRLRHRRWYEALAARQEVFGSGRAAWITALNADHENLRAALRFCLVSGEAAAGAQMACDLWRYWETHGHLTEGRRILSALLDQLDHDDPHRPRALWTAGYMAELQGDIVEARMLLEDGAAAGLATGDVRAIAYALTYLVPVLYYLGEPAQGRAVAEDAIRRHREAGDQIGVVQALMAIGYMHLFAGEPQPAAERFGECASVCQSSGNVWYHTYAQWGLATARWLLDDRDAAAAPASAALSAMRDLNDPIGVALCLDTLAWIAAGQRQAVRALTLLSAVDAAWSAIQIGLPNTLHEQHAAALGTARALASDGAYLAATAKGAAMSEAEAIRYALGESPRPTPGPAVRPGEDRPRLTRRERDVAVLVAQGMSNSQIAAALVISARTVETHVQHIMDKLGCGTRAQIAAWATRPSAEKTPNIRTRIEDSPDAGRAAGRHRE